MLYHYVYLYFITTIQFLVTVAMSIYPFNSTFVRKVQRITLNVSWNININLVLKIMDNTFHEIFRERGEYLYKKNTLFKRHAPHNLLNVVEMV